jgi:glutamine synthetase
LKLEIDALKTNYNFLDVLIVDLFGKLRHVTLPTSYVSKDTFKRGVGFDASNLMYAPLSSSDLAIVPDLNCSFDNPFTEIKTLSSFGNIYKFINKGEMKSFDYDPRLMLNKCVELLRKSGIAYDLMVLPELEFFVFDDISYQLDPMESYFSFISQEKSINNGKAYHITPPNDKLNDLRSDVVKTLTDINVKVKYHHHEVGIPGQCEIELDFENAYKAADNIELAKYVIKNCAQKRNMTATFLPKPIYNTPGSGMHMHMYLVNEKKESIFFDLNNDLNLSKTAMSFIAGILLHLSSLMALTNPSINSFKRLVPGHEAPIGKSFGKGDRSSSIRIPGYTSPESTRIELRTPDGTCNPYYAISAVLLAGIDGIKKELNPSDEKAINLNSSLPRDMIHALECLNNDNDYLADIFGKDFPKVWSNYKLEEAEDCVLYPTPAELETYLDY